MDFQLSFPCDLSLLELENKLSTIIWFVAIDCCDSSVTDISAEDLEIGCKYREKKNTSSLNKILWQNINKGTEK